MSELNVLPSQTATDWSKCCLCQTEKEEELKSPPTRYEAKLDRERWVCYDCEKCSFVQRH